MGGGASRGGWNVDCAPGPAYLLKTLDAGDNLGNSFVWVDSWGLLEARSLEIVGKEN